MSCYETDLFSVCSSIESSCGSPAFSEIFLCEPAAEINDGSPGQSSNLLAGTLEQFGEGLFSHDLVGAHADFSNIDWARIPVGFPDVHRVEQRYDGRESNGSDRWEQRGRSLAPSAGTFSENDNAGNEEQDLASSVHGCLQCPEWFGRAFELEEHARIARHKPFACRQCHKVFSRRDARTRHKRLHLEQGSHPCLQCTKYQGRKAFKRRDHLRKHLLKMHNLKRPDYRDVRCPLFLRASLLSSS